MNMKMAYERPMMHAEMYQTNAYCAGCTLGGAGKDLMGLQAVTLKDGTWYSIPGSRNMGSNITNNSNYSQYSNLTFGGVQNPMTGTGGAKQYYWSTTVNNQTYHLEWSDGWTDTNNKSDETVFVLYKEDQSSSAGLDAAVNWYDWWPGAGTDGDNDGGNWSGKSKFDDVIMAIAFKLNMIKTYWSN